MKQNYLKKLMTALLMLCCTVASAEKFEVDGIYYNILSDEDKTVEVVTRGRNKYSGAVTIPASVTYNSITYSVTSIGERAFYTCSGLTSIVIPASVTSIGGSAFDSCSRLTSIEIPAGVTSIGERAFQGCSGLTSIEIPAGVTSIGKWAFSSCTGLTSIVVDEENTVYDSRNNCNAIIETASNTLIEGCKNTIIPAGVTSIGPNAFSLCSGLTSIVIPEGVTSIGNAAFSICSGLTSIEIPASVTSIGNYAFEGCSGLTSIVIPAGVTSIGDGAFEGCSGLTSIEIPAGVTSIGNYVFFYCTGLTSIVIPASVTSIGNGAFYGCSGLTSITSYIAAENLFVPCDDAFDGVDRTNCTLYVPAGAKATYAATDGWKDFANIVEMSSDGSDATAIEGIETEPQGEAVYYDLSGRRVQNPANGIYIVNGKKVYIK